MKSKTMELSVSVNQILFAQSHMEVRQVIDHCITKARQGNCKQAAFDHFVNDMIAQLDTFSPIEVDSQQWSNIKLARIEFTRLKPAFAVVSHS